MRIIIVEDDITCLELLEESFENAGHTIIKSFMTEQGVYETANHFRPDLIIIDIALKNSLLSGISLANQLKELNLPFVYLTNHKSPGQHASASLSKFLLYC